THLLVKIDIGGPQDSDARANPELGAGSSRARDCRVPRPTVWEPYPASVPAADVGSERSLAGAVPAWTGPGDMEGTGTPRVSLLTCEFLADHCRQGASDTQRTLAVQVGIEYRVVGEDSTASFFDQVWSNVNKSDGVSLAHSTNQ